MKLTKTILPLAAVLAVALPGGSAFAAPKSKFRFAQATYVAGEGQGTIDVTITRAARHGHSRINQTSSVKWSIAGGSADSSDYSVSPDPGTLTFGPGETTKNVTFTINQDSLIEGLESINLKLSAASNNALITNPRTSQVLIADDDGPTQVQLVPESSSVNEAIGTANFYAVRSGDISNANGATTVDYATSDGSATAPADYTAKSGSLSFAIGEFSKTIGVPVIDDSAIENSETFNVTLSNIAGGTFANGASSASASETIVDNDSAPAFALDSTSYSVNEDGSVDVTVLRQSSTNGSPVGANDSFNVTWATADGSATNPADYVPGADQQLEFDASDDAETITIAANDADTQIGLVDDALVEGDEAFGLSLTNAAPAPGSGGSASVGSPSSATVTIHDNDVAPPVAAGNGDGGSSSPATGTSVPSGNSGEGAILGAHACGLVAKAKKAQRVLKQKGLKIALRTAESCKVAVSTTIKQVLPKHKKSAKSARALRIKGKALAVTLVQNKSRTLKVKFSKKAMKAIKNALGAHKKLVATVLVSTRDAASKPVRKTLTITIRR